MPSYPAEPSWTTRSAGSSKGCSSFHTRMAVKFGSAMYATSAAVSRQAVGIVQDRDLDPVVVPDAGLGLGERRVRQPDPHRSAPTTVRTG